MGQGDLFTCVNFYRFGTELINERVSIDFCGSFSPFFIYGIDTSTSALSFLVLVFLSVLLNLILHYRNKSKIQSYYFSVQLLNLLRQATILSKEVELVKIRGEIIHTLTELKQLKKHLSVFRIRY